MYYGIWITAVQIRWNYLYYVTLVNAHNNIYALSNRSSKFRWNLFVMRKFTSTKLVLQLFFISRTYFSKLWHWLLSRFRCTLKYWAIHLMQYDSRLQCYLEFILRILFIIEHKSIPILLLLLVQLRNAVNKDDGKNHRCYH